MPRLELQGRFIDYTVRTSQRAKRVLIKYRADTGLEVVYPSGRRQPAPEIVLQGNAAWILRAMSRLAQASDQQPRRRYRSGEVFSYRGAAYKLDLTMLANGARSKAWLVGATLALACPQSAQLQERRAAVVTWYRSQAKAYLPQRTRQLAEAHGFAVGQLRIKNQKTRWGSCSARGNINLNLRLMMAPDAAIDYVILHELCHLRELNHSAAFWRLVAERCPDYQFWRAWLKENGRTLIF
ncbi:MAG: SprT family zinc-dependent metalloprotease [Chloroflexi bacterium]|nr:SprT family zinc-dependent metalloprotease [Chloroflexota bacterium]MCY4248138.1 SprT family zinc-dependent metalloprotease [Chloroflexota bacterium]